MLSNPFSRSTPKVERNSDEEQSGVKKRVAHPLEDLPSAHEIMQKYEPRFLGKGGENLVYELKGREKFVAKAQKLPLIQTMNWNVDHGLQPGDESEGVEQLESKVAQERERYRKLRDVFGDHVLKQRFFLMNVPVNEAVVEELKPVAAMMKMEAPPYGDSGWTVVSLQEKTDILNKPDAFTTGTMNLESQAVRNNAFRTEPFFGSYVHLTNNLMGKGRIEKADIVEEDFDDVFGRTKFGPLLREMRQDLRLRNAVADFQKKAVEFAEKYDEILDFGLNNIVFHKTDDGEWTYTILDGLYPFDTEVLGKARAAVVKEEMGAEMDLMESNALLQAANFLRIVNGLGKLLRTGAYVDFLPEELEKKGVKMSKVLMRVE